MTTSQLLERIRRLAERPRGLYRVHRASPRLYAIARRQFGSWSAAVRAAGIDYAQALAVARARSMRTRRRNARRRPPPTSCSGSSPARAL